MDPVTFFALCFGVIVWLIVIITFLRLLTSIRDNTAKILEALLQPSSSASSAKTTPVIPSRLEMLSRQIDRQKL